MTRRAYQITVWRGRPTSTTVDVHIARTLRSALTALQGEALGEDLWQLVGQSHPWKFRTDSMLAEIQSVAVSGGK